MNTNQGKASSSGKGTIKSTRKASKATKKAAKQLAKSNYRSQLDDFDEGPNAEIISSLRLGGIDDLLRYDDSASELSADNYDKLASDYDLLLNDVEFLEAKEKLWDAERESLQKQISMLKLENTTIQKKVTELESRLESTTAKGQSGPTTPSKNVTAIETQVPDVIAPAQTKEPEASEKNPAAQQAPKNEPPKQHRQHISKKSLKRTQDVIYVKPLPGHSYEDQLNALRNSDMCKEPYMMEKTRRVKNDVVLVVCKRTANSAELERIVREAIGDIGTVTKTTPTRMLTCTNFNRLVTATEVQQAILERYGVDVKLNNIRLVRTRKNLQRARIRVALRDVKKLEGKKLLIGKSTVTFQTEVQKPPEEEQCFRCMGLGHRANQCEEAQMLCYRCGTSGHRASGCKNTPKCLTCGGGHPTGSRKCQSSRPAEDQATAQAASE